MLRVHKYVVRIAEAIIATSIYGLFSAGNRS